MTVFNAVLPVITLVLGYLGTLVTESGRDRRAAKLALTGRAADEARQEQERLRAVERETANFRLEMLDRAYVQVHDLVRAVARAHLLDRQIAVKLDRPYATTLLPEGASDSLFDANLDLARTEALLLDDEVREGIQIFRHMAAGMTALMNATIEEADARLFELGNAASATEDVIAERMRALYASGARMAEVSPRYHEHRPEPGRTQ